MTRPGLNGQETRSIPNPGPPTLREAVDGLHGNVIEAARLEQLARDARTAAGLGSTEEAIAEGWRLQSRAEKDHWRAQLSAYRIHLDAHPELADKPLGTRCAHGGRCAIGMPVVGPSGAPLREPGADDDDDISTPPDTRLPPERDLELF